MASSLTLTEVLEGSTFVNKDPGLVVAAIPELLSRQVQDGTSISGQTDSGRAIKLSATDEGHLEVAIHSPRMPFGELHVESAYPEFQVDGVYGVNVGQNNVTSSLSGSVTGTNGLLTCSTGTSVGAFGALQSRKRLRYRPGQGIFARFTAMFNGAVASSILVAGVGTAEAGYYFGYNGTSFGILHVTDGKREIRTLTLSSASSTTENVTVTLNGTPFSVPVTNSANINRTAYEIASFAYSGWEAMAVGSTVVFVNDNAGLRSGSFTLSGSTAAGTFAQTLAGQASIDTWIPQSSWNGDKCDGTGTSGFRLTPSNLNVYSIGIQYLGAGTIEFKVEATPIGNNPDFITCHTLKFPNTQQKPNISQPSFPFTMAAYSAGSTTNVSVSTASYGGFIGGEKVLQGNRFSYFNSSTGVAAAAFYTLFTVRNNLVYNGRPNQSVVVLRSLAAALKHVNPTNIFVIKNATLVGNPVFTNYSTISCTAWDTAATSCTYSDNSQLIYCGLLGDTGNFDVVFADEITLQPGETVTIAARTSSTTATYVSASLNTREDQ